MVYSMVKLGDICSITKGKTGIMKAIPGEYPMVGLGEVDKTNIDYQFDAKAVIIPLVSSTGHGSATMKRVKYIEGKFALGTILCAVIPKDDSIVSAKYLQIYLHENRDDLLVSLMKGAANVTLPIKKLYDIEIPLPPIEEQMRIVGLEGNVALINNRLSEEITQQKEYLTKLKQSILQDAISGKLTQEWRANIPNIEPATQLLKQIKATKQQQIKEGKLRKEKPLDPIDESTLPFPIPPTWTWCRLGEISNCIHYGYTASAKTSGSVKLLRITDIQENKVNWISVPFCDISEKNFESYSLNNGDILVARTGGTIGKTYIVNNISSKAVFASYLIRIVPSKLLNYNFLKLFMESPLYWVQLYDKSKGSGQPNVNGESLKNVIVPLPPIQEQHTLEMVINKNIDKCYNIENQITDMEETTQQLTKSILTETFNNN